MNDSKIRFAGAILLLIGLTTTYFFAYLPVQATKDQSSEVTLYSKILFLIPSAYVFGLIALVFGQGGVSRIQITKSGKQRLTILGWIVIAISIAAGIGLNEWMKAILAGYGFSF